MLVLTTGIPPRTRFLALLNNAGHAPIFGATAFLTLRLIRLWGGGLAPRGGDYALALAGTLAIGVVVEVIQHMIGRDASAADVLMDAAGAVFALCWAALRDERWARPTRRRIALGMVGAALLVAAPLAEGALAYARRAAIFPDLARFDLPLDTYFVRGSGASTEVVAFDPGSHRNDAGRADPRYVLRVESTRGSTPGIRLEEPSADWRRYNLLKIDLVNPGDAELALVVRVHDAQHDQSHGDRFNRRFDIEPNSRRTLAIPIADIENSPAGRTLDLSRVAGLVLFDPRRPAPVGSVFLLAGVWLE